MLQLLKTLVWEILQAVADTGESNKLAEVVFVKGDSDSGGYLFVIQSQFGFWEFEMAISTSFPESFHKTCLDPT